MGPLVSMSYHGVSIKVYGEGATLVGPNIILGFISISMTCHIMEDNSKTCHIREDSNS